MALSDKANQPAPGSPYAGRCTVCKALKTLDAESAATLTRWLSDPVWTFAAIADMTRLDEDTPTLAQHALSRHARGGCSAGVRMR